MQIKLGALRRQFAGLAICQGLIEKVDGAVQRGDELGRKALHLRIVHLASESETTCAVVSMLRKSWLTLLTARPKCGKMVFLLQQALQLALHVVQFAFGRADFIGAC